MIAITDLTFPDTASPTLLIFEGVWLLVGVVLLAAAYRAKGEWMKAGLAGMGLSIIGLRLLAVIPSWWLYFSDSHLHWGGQGCTTINIWAKPLASTHILPFWHPNLNADAVQCVKQAVKDTVVVIENAVVLGAMVVGFLIWQKKFPKQLAPGEAKPEATGGYK